MATRQSGLTLRVMFVSPTSFSSSRKGYNSYLKSLGIGLKDSQAILMYGMSFEKFKSLDRMSIDDKIQEAGDRCESLHKEWCIAVENKLAATEKLALDGWDFWAKKFASLVREKHS